MVCKEFNLIFFYSLVDYFIDIHETMIYIGFNKSKEGAMDIMNRIMEENRLNDIDIEINDLFYALRPKLRELAQAMATENRDLTAIEIFKKAILKVI